VPEDQDDYDFLRVPFYDANTPDGCEIEDGSYEAKLYEDHFDVDANGFVGKDPNHDPPSRGRRFGVAGPPSRRAATAGKQGRQPHPRPGFAKMPLRRASGHYAYVYDAWNRLASVGVADSNDGGDPNAEVVVATLTYDGLNRRMKKAITNSADFNVTYVYYYDPSTTLGAGGWRMIETRNGSGDVLKSRRAGMWGLTYTCLFMKGC